MQDLTLPALRFASLLLDQAKYVADQLQASGKGAIMHGLNSSLVKEIVLAIPPLHEQRAILVLLDRETAKIDALIAKVREGIERLKEYRTALISAAVTGKIDVRDEVRAKVG